MADPKTAFAKLLLEMLPPQVLAAGIIKSCGKLANDRPDIAQRILANSWAKVAPALKDALSKEPIGSFAAAALVVESYFVHRGDWKAMERAMMEDSPIDESLAARVVDLISEGTDVLKERVK